MNILNHFPHEVPRPQQIEVINWLEKHWDTKKFFLIDAPPGVGKSAIAVATAKAAGSSYFLTSTKALQDQYLKTFPWLKSIKGKGNYECDVNVMFKVNTAPCLAKPELKAKCLDESRCSYYNDRDAAIKFSKHMVTSYSYQLMAIECGPLKDRTDRTLVRNLMVCDEAHEMDSIIADFLGFEIDPEELQKDHGLDASELLSSKDLDKTVNSILKQKIDPMLSSYENMLERIMNSAIKASGGNFDRLSPNAAKQMHDLVAKRDRLDRLSKRLGRYCENRAGTKDEWLVTKSGKKIIFSPLIGRIGFIEYLSQYADKVILMSASLGDPEQLISELGIPKDQAVSIRVGTPFDPTKSPVFVIPMLKLSAKTIDASLPGVVDAINVILDSHPNEKGIIHAGNYKITSAILNGISSTLAHRLIGKHQFTRGQRQKSNEELIEEHVEDLRPTVLVSPSMHTGVDLAGDLSRFQVIVKLPWMNLIDPRVAKKSEDGNWYSNEMIKKLVQASGRSTRNIDDHSQTYILDEGFIRVWNSSKDIFPNWFKERIIFG